MSEFLNSSERDFTAFLSSRDLGHVMADRPVESLDQLMVRRYDEETEELKLGLRKPRPVVTPERVAEVAPVVAPVLGRRRQHTAHKFSAAQLAIAARWAEGLIA